MTQARWTNYWLKLEDWRLRQHFKRVESILRRRDTSHLPEALQKAREAQLERLHDYAQRSVFPRNESQTLYTPCFIDDKGRECAVAHLLMESEQNELVQTIIQKANYAYVPQMRFPELAQWADESGLTKDEVALIQPGYWSTIWNWLPLALPIWIIGILSLWFNLTQLFLKKKPSWGAFLSYFAFLPLLFLMLLLFWEALIAKSLSTAYDVPEYIHEASGKDVDGLVIGALLTVFLIVALVAIARYRRSLFSKTKR